MKIEQVKAVVEIYRCAALHGHSATPEQIHKLMLLSARLRRLVADGIDEMSVRQHHAYLRAFREAKAVGRGIGADSVSANPGLLVIWSKCPPTIL